MKRIAMALIVVSAAATGIGPLTMTTNGAPADGMPPSRFRAALGSCAGEPAYDSTWDLNADGCINAMDVQRWRAARRPEAAPDGGLSGTELNEIILIEDQVTLANPGQTVSAKIKLHNNASPLFGYSVAIRAVPIGAATGTVSVDVGQTNFFPTRHLILADPNNAPLDPIFSVIQPWTATGVFINANTEDGFTVSATTNVNDVYGQVFFTASPNASGIFALELGPATAMSDGNGEPVPFIFCGGRIAVGKTLPHAADINGDGIVAVDDLLAVINHWGPCPPSVQCIGDLNCDAEVDVDDLLAVINGWTS